jgi:hypothetical protein
MTIVSPDPDRQMTSAPCVAPLRAVLCDAARTLVADITRPVPDVDVVAALARLRRRHVKLGVVHDGTADPAELRAALGPLDAVVAACVGANRASCGAPARVSASGRRRVPWSAPGGRC